MTNLLEPWVLLRLVSGGIAAALFFRAAVPSIRVLRRFDLRDQSEGQLALERQLELSATFCRVGAVVQALTLLLTVLGADRLSRGVRGAMCAYGVFAAHDWGMRSLFVTGAVALVAAVLTQLFAFDARMKTLDLARPLALAACVMAPLSLVDLAAAAKFFLGLDLTVVASCCSIELDAATATEQAHAAGPRVLVTGVALGLVLVASVTAMAAARSPTRARILAAGVGTLLALPPALGAVALEVAPHAFEVPTHVCPFCLLKPDVLALGYPLFGSLLVATAYVGGAALSALLAQSGAARSELVRFAPSRLRRGAAAWALALLVGALPVLRYAMVAGGASLFDGP
jgi:hypothetical protein